MAEKLCIYHIMRAGFIRGKTPHQSPVSESECVKCAETPQPKGGEQMKGICNKCGYNGEMHQVGVSLSNIVKDFGSEIANQFVAVIQCPDCRFNQDMVIIHKERE